MNLKRNKIFPVFLSLMIAGFWLLYRHLLKIYARYPWTNIFRDETFHFLSFLLFGFMVCQAFYSYGKKRSYSVLYAVLSGTLLCIYMEAYNWVILRMLPDEIVYQIRNTVILSGVVCGALLFAVAAAIMSQLPAKKKPSVHPVFRLEALSSYRNHLMGIAMLYVMLYHTVSMRCRYPNPTLRYFIRNGYAGVDIFILLSGMGMVYSLSKNFHIAAFYKKRILRIFPTYIPVVGAYTLFCAWMGYCSITLLFTNCTGLAFWVTKDNYAFNWYVPTIILFYLITPVLYKLLEKKTVRVPAIVVLMTCTVFINAACFDFLNLQYLIKALSRFPVFLLGMLIGFWIKEKRTLSRAEYISLAVIFIMGTGLEYIRQRYYLSVVSNGWILLLTTIPAFCIYTADIMKKINADNCLLMRFLDWTGKNSFLIYLLNVTLVRITRMYLDGYLRNNPIQCRVYCAVTFLLNLVIVYLVELVVKKRKKNA